MKYISRPTPITTVLNTISADAHSETVELESYIAGLEAQQQDRPSRTSEILSMIGSQYSVDIQAILEDYISNLEGKQLIAMPIQDRTSTLVPNEPPVWSQQRTAERERHHKEHELVKQAIVDSEHRRQG